MAESPASLRRKIGSAADLQSVVRAMKAQAAANIGQYEKSVAALVDYAATVELGLGACLRTETADRTGPVQRRMSGGARIHVVVFGSDQGLVGRFNDVVIEHAVSALKLQAPAPELGAVRIWAVGERVRAALADIPLAIAGSFASPGSVQEITSLVGQVLAAVAESTSAAHPATGAEAEVHLFYNRPVFGSTYEPVAQRLLPLDEAWRRGLVEKPWPTRMPPQTVGARGNTLAALVREYLFISIFRACADSLASENASRLAAMDRADRNIDTLLESMNSDWHRLRQSGIDEELSDVICGFQALTGSG